MTNTAGLWTEDLLLNNDSILVFLNTNMSTHFTVGHALSLLSIFWCVAKGPRLSWKKLPDIQGVDQHERQRHYMHTRKQWFFLSAFSIFKSVGATVQLHLDLVCPYSLFNLTSLKNSSTYCNHNVEYLSMCHAICSTVWLFVHDWHTRHRKCSLRDCLLYTSRCV